MFPLCSIGADGRKMAVQGERIPGGFILITGLDGIRYAVLPQSIGIIHDADECRDETLVQLHRGYVVRVPCPLDEVLGVHLTIGSVTPARATIGLIDTN
jgi:hypothetical protein